MNENYVPTGTPSTILQFKAKTNSTFCVIFIDPSDPVVLGSFSSHRGLMSYLIGCTVFLKPLVHLKRSHSKIVVATSFFRTSVGN
jgi:hypothetical protein